VPAPSAAPEPAAPPPRAEQSAPQPEAKPSAPEGFVRRLARAHLQRGLELDRRGDIPQALTEYNASLSLDPSFPEAYLALGGLRARMGDLREAELVYSKATAVSEARPSALLARARLRRQSGLREQAQRDLEGAVESNPERAALEELARSYVEGHAWCAALGVYRRIAAATAIDHDNAAHEAAAVEVQALRVLAAETDPTREPVARHDWIGRAFRSIAERDVKPE